VSDESPRLDPDEPSQRGFLGRFTDNLREPPEEKPPLIPEPWRIPFFLGLSCVALIMLVLLVSLVVVPAVRQQNAASGMAAPKK
jgi:hypothetical protein